MGAMTFTINALTSPYMLNYRGNRENTPGMRALMYATEKHWRV